MKNISFYMISIIAIILSIIAIWIVLAGHFPRTNLDFDYLGLLVGILALLVTILIGWDIYKAISIEKTIREKTDAAECGATCIALTQLGLALYRIENYNAAITALVNALSTWKPQTSSIGDDGAYHAQDLLYKIFSMPGSFNVNKTAQELYILRTIKDKLTNADLLYVLEQNDV